VRYYRQSRRSFYVALSLWLVIALAQFFLFRFPVHHEAAGLHWLDTLEGYTRYAYLAMPIIIYAGYFFSYYEVQPSALEIRQGWRRRSIPYSEINRISPNDRWYSDGKLVEIRYSGLKKLSLQVHGRTDFIDNLATHAPQAIIR
jgi:hypothetical protein